MVFSALVTLCLLASSPTNLSSVFELTPTTEGVVLFPSLFSKITGSPASITATAELVVPRSIPIIFAIIHSPFLHFFL